MKILIKGGRVVDPKNDFDKVADVLVDNGVISEIGENINADGDVTVIDAEGKIVSPGLVDMHSHLRDPGQEYKEDIESGTRSAAMGGITSIACMPNTKPVTDSEPIVTYIKTKAKEVGHVNVYPIGSISKGLEGKELAEIGELKNAGAVAISDDGRPVVESGLMRRALEYAKMFDIAVISHCEDLGLADGGQMPLVVRVQQRLDAQRRAQNGCRSRDASAALKEVQIVHGEPVRQMQLGVLGVFRRFLNGRTGVTALCDQIGQHALTGRGAQGVHGEDLALGVALAQLLGGDAGGIVGRAQTGGETEIENVAAFLQIRLHFFYKCIDIDRGGRGHRAGTQPRIEIFRGDLALVGIVQIFLALEQHAQGKHGNVQRRSEIGGKIGGGIGQNQITVRHRGTSGKIIL